MAATVAPLLSAIKPHSAASLAASRANPAAAARPVSLDLAVRMEAVGDLFGGSTPRDEQGHPRQEEQHRQKAGPFGKTAEGLKARLRESKSEL